MGVSGQRHAPAALYPRGKNLRYPLDRWAPEPVWTQGLEEKSSAPVGDRTSIARWDDYNPSCINTVIDQMMMKNNIFKNSEEKSVIIHCRRLGHAASSSTFKTLSRLQFELLRT
jgi:hypothetical protein